MPIRFKLQDGRPTSAEADTVEEAASFLRQFDGASSIARTAAVKPAAAVEIFPKPLPPSAKRLVKELQEHPEGLPGSVLAKALEMEPKGLGPVVVSLLKWGKRAGLPKRDILVKERRRQNGVAVRILKLGKPLLKRLKEGGIPDLEF